MNRNKKREQEEQERLQEQLSKFESDFGDLAPPPTVGKTFIRMDIVNANQSIAGGAKPELYKPMPTITLPKVPLPASAATFEDAKKLAAEKARRMMEEALKGKGLPPPAVIPPSTKAPVARPPKPGSAIAQKEVKKMSQLESFKMELQKVQEERDKRKGIRDQLVKGGIDTASVDRIAPALDKPYLGGGEFDDDPFTTNLYVGNLPKDVTMDDIFDTFGSYGPLASAKILYPRNEEEKLRQFLCGFVAYMSRVDVDRAMAYLPGVAINDEVLKMSFAKPVQIPVQPFYIPPPLQELSVPDPPTGLPFNAKPLLKDLNHFLATHGSLPSLNTPLPRDNERLVADYKQMIKNSTIRVVIPTDSHLLTIIHRTVEFVVKEGPLFEAIVMSHEAGNPLFRFLYETFHPAHVYYRWRIYSLMNGDTLSEWRMHKFRMFEGGSWWQPPVPTTDLFKQMPESLYYYACHNMDPEKYFPNKRDHKFESRKRSRSASDDEGHGRSDAKRAAVASGKEDEESKKKKKYLSSSERDAFEDMLRSLTPEKDKVGDAMVWCCEHATCAKEVCDCLYESLTIDETPLHKKIARLYLICDILANCAQRGVRDVFYFRQYFGDLLEQIFEALGKTLSGIEARLKKEQFKQRVMACFGAFEDKAIYPNDVLIKCQNIFLGLIIPKKDERDELSSLIRKDLTARSDSEEDDIDGAPIDDDEIEVSGGNKNIDAKAGGSGGEEEDIDGVPLEKAHLLHIKPATKRINIFEGDSDSDSEEARRQAEDKSRGKKLSFKPAFANLSEPMVRSKWDEEKEDEKPESGAGGRRGRDAVTSSNQKRDDSDTDGEIDESNDPATFLANASEEEERRKIMREIEIKVMALQDDLEAENDPDIKKKVAEYRKKETEKAEEKLVKKLKKRQDKEAKKEKKKEKEKVSSGRERERSRERERERDRDRTRRDDDRKRSHSRERDRRPSSRERDRDRRRERSRSRDRDVRDARRRSSSRDRSRRERSRSRDRRRK